MHKGILFAILAAVLFGASTPFAKTLVVQVSPVVLAGLLYLGSGVGLAVWMIVRAMKRRGQQAEVAHLKRAELPWLTGAVVAGGITGPLLLMIGLTITSASTASLLLNMEGVLTAALAWFVFKENFDRRIFAGMALIVAAGILLAWQPGQHMSLPWGSLAIVGACLCWAIDNNLTRKVSASDAVQIACIKGLGAGSVNLAIAWMMNMPLPTGMVVLTAGIVGFCGYGLSLVLFVLALRHLGTARTGAYFSVAPFAGAAISIVMLGDTPTPVFWAAVSLMAAGIWLHLTETHGHTHTHLRQSHTHRHSHDAHHQHEHGFVWDGTEPHSHPHVHEPMTHSHDHFPDIHHRHQH